MNISRDAFHRGDEETRRLWRERGQEWTEEEGKRRKGEKGKG
jgi:hypothetical protein